MMVEIAINCAVCDRKVSMSLDYSDFRKLDKWLSKDRTEREPIQNALPFLTADQREMFISRICPTCWDAMFKGEPEEDESEEDDE